MHHPQACHAAYELTTESEVYQCTGNPEPADIEEIMKAMMNDSFEVAYQRESAHDQVRELRLTLSSFFLPQVFRL